MKTYPRLLGMPLIAMLLTAPAQAQSAPSAENPSASKTLKEQLEKPNTWVKLENGSYGGRNSTAVVYLPEEETFIMVGGYAGNDRYSEQTFNRQKGIWENRFPLDKIGTWGDLAGAVKAPKYAYGAPAFKDTEGNFRPNLSHGYNHRMEVWGCAALDRKRGKVVVPFHMLKQTYEYDPKRRTWALSETANDAPNEFWDDIVFGKMCYDPVNKYVLAGRCRWAHKDGKWIEQKFGSTAVNGLLARAESLALAGRCLLGACRARFYLTESESMQKTTLTDQANAVKKISAELFQALLDAGKTAAGYERSQIARALDNIKSIQSFLNRAMPLLADKITPATIQMVEEAWEATDDLTESLATAPPGRAYYGLACDEKHGKIVLFGGHRLDRTVSDTWVYDCKTRQWEQRFPKHSPSPRYGHGLVWLPKSGLILLSDGTGYKGDGQSWTYDIDKNEWTRLLEGNKRGSLTSYASTWGWQPEVSAALPDDTVITLCNINQKDLRYTTWAARIDPSQLDLPGTEKLGTPAGREIFTQKTSDPKWYDTHTGDTAPVPQEEWIQALPANAWIPRPLAQNRPDENRAWGTVVLDPDRDQILHWGGGHVAYVGNCVLHYSLKANQYYIGHRPEVALRYAHGQGGMTISKSYRNRAFMTGHAYHSYAFDPVSGKIVVCGQDPKVMVKDKLFFAYDPAITEWVPGPIPSPFGISYSGTYLCSTPRGIVAWAGNDIWRLNVAEKLWTKQPHTGAKFPGGGPDLHGMTYDSKRDRLLLFSSLAKGDVMAYDIKTGQATALKPEGMDKAAAPSREAVYIPEHDAVIIGAANMFDKPRWLYYDCGKNAWLGLGLAGKDLNRAGFFNMGVVHDPNRKLLWAMGAYSELHAMRLDPKTADLLPLKALTPAPPKQK